MTIPWNSEPEISRVSTHSFPERREMDMIRGADVRIVGGSNLMSGNIRRKRQWRLKVFQHFQLSDITLMGVGWWQYMPPPTLVTKLFMSRLLARDGFHSVRDSYTCEQMKLLGYKNVINTTCPTLWSLPEIVTEIPYETSKDVIFTLTDYNRDLDSDVSLVNTLRDNYETVFFWPQGESDLEYFNTFSGVDGVIVIDRSLEAFTALLSKHGSLDYVGTRLHGGIQAMHYKRRSLILAVDNRAAEISKDTGIQVVQRKDIAAIRQWIIMPLDVSIQIDTEAIRMWKNQFAARGLADTV